MIISYPNSRILVFAPIYPNFDSRFNPTSSLFMVHHNIRPLQKHFDSLCESLRQLPFFPQIIGISETKIHLHAILNIPIPNYTFIHSNSSSCASGVGLYISNDTFYNIIGKHKLLKYGCENIWISFNIAGNGRKTIIGVVYRHPKHDASEFLEAFNNLIDDINCKNHDQFILGDLNINILFGCRTNIVNEYLVMMARNGLFPLIIKSTRLTENTST